jgi:pyruvate dehydrogenase E2 component (dihydrolipoyllysine-residue acetyltransferase)
MEGQLVEQTKIRAAIARRMVESKQQAPHFYVQTEVTMDGVRDRLEALNERGGTRATVTVALVRACVEALRRHPKLNSVWTPEGLLQASPVNLGIAIALDEGLVAPALLGADELDVDATATALRDLVERARASRLRPAEMTDATFTLSNLGMFDVSAFTAIVTPPQVAILAVARDVERWSFDEGQAVRRSVMTVTLSADHRALDGVDVARFLETFKQAIENSETLLAEPELKEAMS